MSKQEQLNAAFRDVLNKLSWLNGQEMKVAFEGLHSSEVHCIEYIGNHRDVNVTKLAEALYQTRGGISKITKKLTHKGIVSCFQKPDNRKEVFFRLTAQGEAIHAAHAALHQTFQARDKAIFEAMTDEQYKSMLQFAERYGRHLDLEIAKQNP